MSHITGYTQDARGYWREELSCGHSRPITDRPPFRNDRWIWSAAKRAERIGHRRECRQCESREGRDAA